MLFWKIKTMLRNLFKKKEAFCYHCASYVDLRGNDKMIWSCECGMVRGKNG